MAADLVPGAVPRTTFGLITEALRRRWQRGQRPFTVMSCDNLQDNGYLSKRVFTAFARLRDPELGDWVEREARFPNSMVDRITPVTTNADRAEVRERFGSRTGGRSSASPIRSGCSRTPSRSAGHRMNRLEFRSLTTWSRTS